MQLDPDRFLCHFVLKATNRSNIDTTASQSVAIFHTDKKRVVFVMWLLTLNIYSLQIEVIGVLM